MTQSARISRHRTRKLKPAAAGLLAVGLAGCVTLLPKAPPVQLYRFGVAAPASAPARSGAVGVSGGVGQFQREAAGDRLLTVDGDRAAYIAGARWVAPADVLFQAAVVDAFETAPGRVRLVSRGEPVRSDYVLRLDVRNFETDYAQGRSPAVLVRIRAVLASAQPHATVTEQVFEARVPATQNRVTAIVAAYDQALAKVLGDIAAWANSSIA